MTQQIKKQIASVSINYEDGSQTTLQYYALVGLSGDTWYKVMLSPPANSTKIKLNNSLAELSLNLIESIKQEK